MTLVETPQDIIDNVLVLAAYRNGNKGERDFHNGRIKNGKLFVVLKRGDDYFFAPSKFAGYKNNDLSHIEKLEGRDGRITNRTIEELLGKAIEQEDPRYAAIDEAFVNYCSNLRIEPSKHHRRRRYWPVTPIGTG
jgi:5-methylcytosine-specific restriction protein A